MALRTKESEMATSYWELNIDNEDLSVQNKLARYADALNKAGLSKKEKALIAALIQECLRQMKPEKKKRKKKK